MLSPPLTPAHLQNALSLTPRQAEVALLLASRRSNREIAEALHISEHTARHHTQAVLKALNLNDRREVGARLQRLTGV